jgi:signal peptidase I
MHHIYDEISGPAKILSMKTTPRWQRDWRGLPRRMIKHGLSYLLVLAAAYGFFKFSHEYIMQSVQVNGNSMAPTLPDAKCYLLNRLVYRVRTPKPKEIVVLRDPETDDYAIKRIVAKPGDSVYVKGGQLFVNGILLPEPYLGRGTKTYAGSHYRAQMWVCGLNQYFVLGDNRENSADSRTYGAVSGQNILGLVTP